MKRASILDQLNKNKTEIAVIEECLMRNLSQADGTDLLAELKALMDERYIYMQTLTAFTLGHSQESSVRFFSPEHLDSENLEHQCASMVEKMNEKLTKQFETGEITPEMYSNAQAAIKYELQFLNATTIEQFNLQSTTAIAQALDLTSSQPGFIHS